MTNLLLVKEDLKDLEIFQNGINSNTVLLKDPSLNDFLSAIDSNTTHIGFVYHYQGYPSIEFFNDVVIEDNYDESGNLLPPNIDLSDNRFINQTFLNMLIEVKKINPNVIFDLLTCNITDTKFINEISKLTDEYGFTFRYSTNEKGYSGDWIQESHNVSIKDVYFNENIDLWEHVLTASRTISYVATTYPTFFELNGSNILRLKQNFTWGSNNLNTNFITLATGEIFDGQGYSIDVSSSLTANFEGLFASSANRPIIRNLTVNNFKTMNNGGGIIVRGYQSYFEINNSNSTGTIGVDGGGICGRNCTGFEINNCYSTGNSGIYGGGICGYACSNIEINNCYSTGTIGSTGGGICGYNCRNNVLINNCYSTGTIGVDGGGICGRDCTNNIIINNCYSTGTIGSTGGGICGRGCNTNIEINNCYSTGTISINSGGICGSNCNNNVVINNCYSTGNIDSYGGGICGSNCYTNLVINYCYSTGNIGSYGGGICGYYCYTDIEINDCYSIGTIGGLAGGISSNGDGITTNNCVSNSPLGRGGNTDNNSSTDLNNIFNNNSYIYNTLGWLNTIWKGLFNNYPRLATNFQISPNDNFSDNDLSGVNFSNTNLTGVNFSNTNLTNATFTNAITGPLQSSTNIVLSNNYFIINNYIIGSDVDITIKNNAISSLIIVTNNELVDISNVVLNTNLLGNTDTEKYTELIKIYNQLRVPFNKINLKNLNKNGYWLNLNNPLINIPEISNNEYLYLLNVPETDISLSINNQFVANVRKSGSNYIINNTSYSENQKVYLNNYRFITGSFLVEPINIVNQIDSIINNQTITIKYVNNLNINGSIVNVPITTVDASVNYLLYSGFRGSLIKFSLNSNITNFSEDPLFLEFDLPNITDTTKTLKLYKIINNQLVIDSNYPVNVTYSDNKWRTNIVTLSDFVVVDENAPETIVGGDPFIKSLKTNKVLLLPNSWKKVILYQSSKYKVIGYNEKLKSEQMLKMKTLKENKIVDITKMETSIYNFNYLVKIEIINLENNNVALLDTINGNIINNNDINIEEIITKNGLNSVDKNFYYPKKNFKSFMIHLDKSNYITVKVDNYWIDLNNIKLYSNNYVNISGELVEHNNGNNI